MGFFTTTVVLASLVAALPDDGPAQKTKAKAKAKAKAPAAATPDDRSPARKAAIESTLAKRREQRARLRGRAPDQEEGTDPGAPGPFGVSTLAPAFGQAFPMPQAMPFNEVPLLSADADSGGFFDGMGGGFNLFPPNVGWISDTSDAFLMTY